MRWLVLALIPMVGCNGIKRLTDGEAAPDRPVTVIHSNELGETPVFSVATPAGKTKHVLHGWIPLDGLIRVPEGAQVDVFFKDDITPVTWFKLGTTVIPAYYYSYDAGTGIVLYHGRNLSTHQEYCVYYYV